MLFSHVTCIVFPSSTLKNPTDNPFHKIMRASHVIKGAASNLMCAQLRTAAMQLEQAAAAAHESGGEGAEMETVREKCTELKTAVDNYHAFLYSIGI
jgi:HPt (histidine-containing phosphotransfer) domain-containing protein